MGAWRCEGSSLEAARLVIPGPTQGLHDQKHVILTSFAPTSLSKGDTFIKQVRGGTLCPVFVGSMALEFGRLQTRHVARQSCCQYLEPMRFHRISRALSRDSLALDPL